MGFRWISRAFGAGGPYPVSCAACFARAIGPGRANELAFLSDVRRLLARCELTGESLAGCRRAVVDASATALVAFGSEHPLHRPSAALAARAIGARLRPNDLKLRRPAALKARAIDALDAEITERANGMRAESNERTAS
jgi:hypothetical protein